MEQSNVTEASSQEEAAQTPGPVLELRDLKIHFPFRRGGFLKLRRGWLRAVDGISLAVGAGETVALVGESKCGKTALARAVLDLVSPTAGEIHLGGRRIDELTKKEQAPLRRQVQPVPAEPSKWLRQNKPAEQVIAEPMADYDLHPPASRPIEAARLMETVGLSPRDRKRPVREFSAEDQQRISIARALAAQPQLIVCDEPVAALDIAPRARVTNRLLELRESQRLSCLYLTRDLAMARQVGDRIGVMYLGRIVELAGPDDLVHPRHPYTQALLSSCPIPDPELERQRTRAPLGGEPPTPDRSYPGCPFVDRCPVAEIDCCEVTPALTGATHQVACPRAE